MSVHRSTSTSSGGRNNYLSLCISWMLTVNIRTYKPIIKVLPKHSLGVVQTVLKFYLHVRFYNGANRRAGPSIRVSFLEASFHLVGLDQGG